jgi:2-octaprenyl-6-methoxyphenol hydroxylase
MKFDVVIVGGGLVGMSLALALKNQALKVALLERDKIEQGIAASRALALSATSVVALNTLNLWQKLVPFAEPILEVQVSEQGHFGVTRLIPPQGGGLQGNALGFVINAHYLLSTLAMELQTLSNLTLFCPDEIKEMDLKEEYWDLRLQSGNLIHTKLVIAADGANSMLRQKRGIGVKTVDYQQTAILCELELSRSHQGVAYERFMKNGSIAMLPLAKNKVKAVYIVATSVAEKWLKASDVDFLKELQEAFGYQLGRFLGIGTRSAYGLKKSVSETLYDERLLFVGNAANSISPVAAQGFNLGLRDIAFVAELLLQSCQEQQDIGAKTVLQKYAALRREDHEETQLFTHTLATSKLSRRFGMLATAIFPNLKGMLLELGSGRRIALPKLCRGISLANKTTAVGS